MGEINIFSDSFFAMGTRCDVVFTSVDTPAAENVFHLIKNEVKNLEFRMSRFIPDSPLSVLNAAGKNKWIQVPDDLWEILSICYDFYQISNGAFDITASSLIQLWKKNDNPSELQIQEALKNSGFNKVEFDFDNHRIRFLNDNIEFDLGAVGKGIALDFVKPVLMNRGIVNGIVSFGESSVLALGNHPNGKKWPLGIRNSYNPAEYVHVFSACNETVTTSGTILNSDDGEVIWRKHIISPATGLPVELNKNISVKSASATWGEFLSTVLLILPENDQILLTEKMKEIEILEVQYSEEKEVKTKLTLL